MVTKQDRRRVLLRGGGRGGQCLWVRQVAGDLWGKLTVRLTLCKLTRQATKISDVLFLFQDVSETSCSKYPRLYIPGQKNQLFNKKIFFMSLLYGTLTSLAIFFVPYGVFQDRIANDGLETSSVYFFGTVVAAILVVVVNIEVRRRPFDDTNRILSSACLGRRCFTDNYVISGNLNYYLVCHLNCDKFLFTT